MTSDPDEPQRERLWKTIFGDDVPSEAEHIEIARRRKLAAKRLNEHLKLLATSFNAVALTTFGAALILPSVTGAAVASQWIWILIAAALHFVAHIVLRFLRSED